MITGYSRSFLICIISTILAHLMVGFLHCQYEEDDDDDDV